MTEHTVKFLREEDAATLNKRGRPLSEEIISIDPGPCVKCGRTPEDGAVKGTLSNTYIVEGVLKGDALCQDCDKSG